MIYKERYGSIQENLPVSVYRNLTSKCWSMASRHKDTRGKVVLHASALWIENPTSFVSDKGRERTRREKSRNVHAHIKGEFLGANIQSPADSKFLRKVKVLYNPYHYEQFSFENVDGTVHAIDEYPGKPMYAEFTDTMELYYYFDVENSL